MDVSKMRARMKMRKVAGQQVARQDRTSKAFAKAEAEAKNAPYAGESGIDVEGNKPRPRLDRPARASGGRVCRADGGPTLSKEREEYAAKKDTEAKKHDGHAKTDAIVSGTLLGLMGGSRVRKIAQGVGAGLVGADMIAEGNARKNAEQEAKWARSGKAEEGKEDRKRGGRVARDKDCD